MSRNDLENILREHLSNELGGQRGRAADVFAQQVVGPMQRRLEQEAVLRANRWRHRMTLGLAMAACLVIGLFLPRFLPRTETEIAKTTGSGGIATPIASQIVDFEHTNMVQRHDVGHVMLDETTPGRRIRQEQVDRYRWTDPTGGKYEYVTPSDQEILLEVHRQ